QSGFCESARRSAQRYLPPPHAAGRPLTLDRQPVRNPLRELADMGDHADHTVGVAQALERIYDDVQRLGVERAEALVDEHRLQPRADSLTGDVGDAAAEGDGEAEGSEERLAAGQCVD